MHRAEPQRMSGLDLYSTTLWHLKKEVDLAYLAQQATDADKLSSEAWCVAGNCFSLQKEHDMALSFFQRVRYPWRSVCLLIAGSRRSVSEGDPTRSVLHLRVHIVRPRVRGKRGL